jgi:hypothetical protein
MPDAGCISLVRSYVTNYQSLTLFASPNPAWQAVSRRGVKSRTIHDYSVAIGLDEQSNSRGELSLWASGLFLIYAIM